MAWFKKEKQHQVELPADTLAKLKEHLARLGVISTRLVERATAYLLDDTDHDVLNELAARPESLELMRLLCSSNYGHVGSAGWSEFIDDPSIQQTAFVLRLAKLMAAAARHAPANRFFCQDYFDRCLWLEVLLQEATSTAARVWSSVEKRTALTGPFVESLLEADGRSVEPFLTTPFRASNRNWQARKPRQMVLGVSQIAESFVKHRSLVAPFLVEGNAESRLTAVENLLSTETPAGPFVAELVACATHTSKQLREAAGTILRTAVKQARPLLEQAVREGSRTERESAVWQLAALCGPAAMPFLESVQASETSKPVQAAILAALQEAKPSDHADAGSLEPPAREPLPLNPPLMPPVRQLIADVFAAYNAFAQQHNQELASSPNRKWPLHPNHPLQPLGNKDVASACKMIETGDSVGSPFGATLYQWLWRQSPPKNAHKLLLEHPDFQLVQLIRFLRLGGLLDRARDDTLNHPAIEAIERYRTTHTPKITLCDLADALASVGATDDVLVKTTLESYFPALDWEPEAAWPFLVSHLDAFEAAFDPPSSDTMSAWRHARRFRAALRLLTKFPQVPPRLLGRVWNLAIGTTKDDRQRAQKVAVKLPDLQSRLAQALLAGSFQTRAIAAEWLGRLADPRAIEPLETAAQKEKQDAALDEMLTALEKLGQPLERYLDRNKLAADAAKGLKKGTPPALEWFPWDQVPAVHWQDTGKQIPTEVVTWLLVQNYKLKSAEPGPLLVRYCALIRRNEREDLGKLVLSAWLQQDLLRKYSDAEARSRAQSEAQGYWQRLQQSLQWYQKQGNPPPPGLQKSQQEIEDQLFQNFQREVGTAIDAKGLLAVAGACCGPDAVGPVQKYLKDWFGYRAAQCKALIAMLSGIDHPSAIQFLLSISNRFRTKGIREEAERYMHVLAARKGWTLDELADRTMPTAGFDEEGKLELNFGPRRFVARVNAELEAVLYDEEGKPLKALPSPRTSDDEELAKAAKKAFSTAKSELKKFSALQRQRLYEAMCVGRGWPAADWRRYLFAHPLFRFLCVQLVWSAGDGEQHDITFRPLEDGSLTDAADNEVELADAHTIRLAHSCQLSAAQAAAWTQHLVDYDVSPLFTQFGRRAYELPAERHKDSAIADFEGHVVEAFKLRSMATKAGYTRGQAEDGGWFYTYYKHFPGVGLKARLEFSGNGLPEENRPVALVKLSFEKSAGDEDGRARSAEAPLGDVPSVLLTECYNDLAIVAAAGTGFDPEWAKKVY